jgi:hypothetical protein
MSYIGKVVRLSSDFLRNTGQVVGDGPLKIGVVVSEKHIQENRFLLVVDDAAFGIWKALSSNVEVVSSQPTKLPAKVAW